MNIVGGMIEDLTEKYADYADVVDCLKSVQKDIMDNVDEIKNQLSTDNDNSTPPQARNQLELMRERVLRKYKVNVIVDNEKNTGASSSRFIRCRPDA